MRYEAFAGRFIYEEIEFEVFIAEVKSRTKMYCSCDFKVWNDTHCFDDGFFIFLNERGILLRFALVFIQMYLKCMSS